MHHKIASLGGILGESNKNRATGITGMVYRNIRTVSGLVGDGIDLLGLIIRWATLYWHVRHWPGSHGGTAAEPEKLTLPNGILETLAARYQTDNGGCRNELQSC